MKLELGLADLATTAMAAIYLQQRYRICKLHR